MRQEYDFTNAKRNPFADRIRREGVSVREVADSVDPAEPQVTPSPISFEDVLSVAKDLEGQDIPTLAGRSEFRAIVVGHSLIITPKKTGKPRSIGEPTKTIERFNETGSWKPSEYQDITFNSVYVLKLIALARDQKLRV